MDEPLQFTTPETFDHKAVLAEAIEIITHADLELGPKSHDRNEKARQEKERMIKEISELAGIWKKIRPISGNDWMCVN